MNKDDKHGSETAVGPFRKAAIHVANNNDVDHAVKNAKPKVSGTEHESASEKTGRANRLTFGRPLAHNLSRVVSTVPISGTEPEEASGVTLKLIGAKGRTEAAFINMDHIATTDHVYLLDGSENTTILSCETVKGRAAIAPGRGGDRDKIKWFKTGKTVVESLDPRAAILDNLCLENFVVTTDDTSEGTKGALILHKAAENRKEVTKRVTDNVKKEDTTSSVGKGYEIH